MKKLGILRVLNKALVSSLERAAPAGVLCGRLTPAYFAAKPWEIPCCPCPNPPCFIQMRPPLPPGHVRRSAVEPDETDQGKGQVRLFEWSSQRSLCDESVPSDIFQAILRVNCTVLSWRKRGSIRNSEMERPGPGPLVSWAASPATTTATAHSRSLHGTVSVTVSESLRIAYRINRRKSLARNVGTWQQQRLSIASNRSKAT